MLGNTRLNYGHLCGRIIAANRRKNWRVIRRPLLCKQVYSNSGNMEKVVVQLVDNNVHTIDSAESAINLIRPRGTGVIRLVHFEKSIEETAKESRRRRRLAAEVAGEVHAVLKGLDEVEVPRYNSRHVLKTVTKNKFMYCMQYRRSIVHRVQMYIYNNQDWAIILHEDNSMRAALLYDNVIREFFVVRKIVFN